MNFELETKGLAGVWGCLCVVWRIITSFGYSRRCGCRCGAGCGGVVCVGRESLSGGDRASLDAVRSSSRCVDDVKCVSCYIPWERLNPSDSRRILERATRTADRPILPLSPIRQLAAMPPRKWRRLPHSPLPIAFLDIAGAESQRERRKRRRPRTHHVFGRFAPVDSELWTVNGRSRSASNAARRPNSCKFASSSWITVCDIPAKSGAHNLLSVRCYNTSVCIFQYFEVENFCANNISQCVFSGLWEILLLLLDQRNELLRCFFKRDYMDLGAVILGKLYLLFVTPF